MKKILKLILLLTLLPITIKACPHSDKDGNPHFQFYNEDYTIMEMLYPKQNHIYSKFVPIGTGTNLTEFEDEIINELFGFPLIQGIQSYLSTYWFMDESLLGVPEEELNVKTTVEGLEYMQVTSTNYNLLVYLTNTYNDKDNYTNQNTHQMYYNINTEFKDIPIFNIITNPLEIKAEYSIITATENTYERQVIKIFQLNDKIEVQINSEQQQQPVYAVNIEKTKSESNYIEAIYINNAYTFEISESGTYILTTTSNEELEYEIYEPIETQTEQQLELENSKDTENSKKIPSIPSIVYIITPIILFLIITIILLFKKKN